MGDDQPPGPGSWRRENDGPWQKIEAKTARCARKDCGHSQAQHGGRSNTGACNGSHYGGYSPHSCSCARFKAEKSDDLRRAPLPPPFPVGVRVRYTGTRTQTLCAVERWINGVLSKIEGAVTVLAPGMVVTIDGVKRGRRGTGRFEYFDDHEPDVDETIDGWSLYTVAGNKRAIYAGAAGEWEVVHDRKAVRMTPAQIADLRRCIARCDATKGTFDYPNGDAIALRTGAALERRGWVVWANKGSANRRRRWLPTEAGRAALAAMETRQ